ncbi:MAG TPA: amidohydrolase [Methyloprofundus sp.]|uniref:M20 aminoacylase family protein n=1 Tax=Methyloprofundus sp. TaxID=2020875 RepID=UPI0018424261|nr:M20 aminoacylase family protein [Methyloprofundus sp.]HIG65648.1 amidohydrolase [Methyloprofundus sp.]HIL78590.1 amidohydrolase [Methylococcales bacterium]
MSIYKEIEEMHAEMCSWRQHLHQFPETAFDEFNTAKFISEKLTSFGLDVHQGLGRTGVVASLSCGKGSKKIALRADMDALFIQEKNQLSYKSQNDGIMHACGHDGHSAMLLGAAKYLATHADFDGTVYFVFQPAEEGRAGARQMIDDGLFDLFPADCVFGLHNFPDVPQGHFAIKSGAMMASFDCFEIVLSGQATHAAMPQKGNDVIVAAGHIINALQTVVSRNVAPADSAVLSITQVHAGNTWNAIPDTAVIRGTYRCFTETNQQLIKDRLMQITESLAQGFAITAEININPENAGYPVTRNSDAETALAISVAQEVVGVDKVNMQPVPSMGSEDFSFMLEEKPGCYVWLGNGSSDGGCLLHNPHYDFNDQILIVGASYWVKLVERVLHS